MSIGSERVRDTTGERDRENEPEIERRRAKETKLRVKIYTVGGFLKGSLISCELSGTSSIERRTGRARERESSREKEVSI